MMTLLQALIRGQNFFCPDLMCLPASAVLIHSYSHTVGNSGKRDYDGDTDVRQDSAWDIDVKGESV